MSKKIIRFLSLLLVLVSLSGCAIRPAGSTQTGGTSVQVNEDVIAEPTPSPIPAQPEEIQVEEEPEESEEEPATRLEVPITMNGKNMKDELTDGEYWSSAVIKEDFRFEIGSLEGEKISSLYLKWAERPLPYFIVYADGSAQEVDGGMLHEVVHLDRPSSLVSIAISYAGTYLNLSEVEAYTEGKLPEGVQDWKRMGEGEADIVLFPTHADDEYIFFGGILPYYAGELGKKVQVCWLCCHDTYSVRNHELLNALWKSGCRYYPEINYNALDKEVWSYEDAVFAYSFEQFEKYQVEMIRKYRPLVVVGHDLKGEYGHGAHMLGAATMQQAVEDAAVPFRFPESAAKYGAWSVQKAYLHLYGEQEEMTRLDYNIELENFGGMTAWEAADECFAEHASQNNSGFHVYRADERYDASAFGLVKTSVGEDEEKNDLLEHIDWDSEKTPVEYSPTDVKVSSDDMTDRLLDFGLFNECEEQGKVESRAYTCTDVRTGRTEQKKLLVYTPYGYNPENKYNVLILTQGAGSDETYWFAEVTDEAGRTVSVPRLLDNMISLGLCQPLIVVSTNWFNSNSCNMTTFGMEDLRIASKQQVAEMKNEIVPFIVENYSTYAENSGYAAITEARDHFGYAGLSWGSMTCVLGMMKENTDIFSWFGSFGPGLFDLDDTKTKLEASATITPIHYFLMCCGTDDGELPKSHAMYDRVTENSIAVRDGDNAKFIEILGGKHWYGTWDAGLYNALLVFFTGKD